MTIKRINAGKGHWYKLDGEKADGVTTLIKNGVPTPALVGWSARRVAEYAAAHLAELTAMQPMGERAIIDALRSKPFHERNDAAVRGTEVHRYAERIVTGEAVDVPPALAPYVQACANFLDDWHVRPILRETVVASRTHRYCGTLDLVGRFGRTARSRRRVGIFDYKTGARIYGETALQLAAYGRAEAALLDGQERTFGPLSSLNDAYGVESAWAVRLGEDGTYSVHKLDVSDSTFELFLHAAAVARGRGKDGSALAELVSDQVTTEEL